MSKPVLALCLLFLTSRQYVYVFNAADGSSSVYHLGPSWPYNYKAPGSDALTSFSGICLCVDENRQESDFIKWEVKCVN